MSEWQTRGSLDRLSDTPTDGIPVVRDEIWGPAHAPAETYRAPSAPTSRWAHLLAGVRPYARIFVIVAMYLSTVAAVSLIVTRVMATPANGTSAAGTGHQPAQNGLGSHTSAPPTHPASHKHKAPHRRSATQPGFAPPLLSPSPAPTPAPSPTSSRPTSPPPTSPPPTSPPPTSPPPTSPPPTSPPPTSPPPTSTAAAWTLP